MDVNGRMELASRHLVNLEYLACEAVCLEVLREVRAASDWATLARVLLPLQESRRQRRLFAVEAGVHVLAEPSNAPSLSKGAAVVLSGDAATLEARARQARQYVEVLRAEPDAAGVRVAPATGGWSATVPAPAFPLAPGRVYDEATAGHWYLAAGEAVGDVVLAEAERWPVSADTIDRLLLALDVVGDHELLHQRVAAVASELGRLTLNAEPLT